MLHRRCERGLRQLAALLSLALMPVQLLVAQPLETEEPQAFSEQWLQSKARSLAARPYQSRELADDHPLRALSYDEHRQIAFDPERAIWREDALPFQLQLFHPGFLHTTPVDVHLVLDGQARRLSFTPQVFDYRDRSLNSDLMDANGYAGFRVHHPLNTDEYYDEFLVFQGASYFRAVGKDQWYGLSARGLAVNTVGEGDEEFPNFTDFWIEQPDPTAGALILHALLDSPSVTGAYRFTVMPGETTHMEVDARLYPRRTIPRIGIAPLTSMFLFNNSNRADFDDFRDAVHDSDGLRILQANGEAVWRPLINPSQVQVSSFGATDTPPVGFGLLQRRQKFERFNDAEARYDKRPSLWIEPLGTWGPGRVELLEIPTEVEYHDNVVAYWQPSSALKAGESYRFRYRMHWGAGSPEAPKQGRVVNTAAGQALDSDERVFVIDYGDGAASLPTDPEAVRIRATSSAGVITDVRGQVLEANGDYRVSLMFDPDGAPLAELRVTLEVDGDPWGETWLYRWTP